MENKTRKLKEGEINLTYYIGEYKKYGIPAPQIHKKFRKIYGKNKISEKEIYETQFPKRYSTLYNYKINDVEVKFYCMNPKLHRTIWPTKIYVKGLEKNINKLVNDMKKTFRLEED